MISQVEIDIGFGLQLIQNSLYSLDIISKRITQEW
jgi:hypothetical protein